MKSYLLFITIIILIILLLFYIIAMSNYFTGNNKYENLSNINSTSFLTKIMTDGTAPINNFHYSQLEFKDCNDFRESLMAF